LAAMVSIQKRIKHSPANSKMIKLILDIVDIIILEYFVYIKNAKISMSSC
jgi:hypothetical protein